MRIVKWIWRYLKRIVCAILNRNCGPDCNCKAQKMKAVPKGNKGLSKLPTGVRNKMGYMKKGGTPKKMNSGGVSTTKPKKRPSNGLNKTSRSTAKANKIAAMWIKHHKETNTEDFKQASSLLQDYVKQINKKKAKENK